MNFLFMEGTVLGAEGTVTSRVRDSVFLDPSI